ncbi:TrmH family RNA methyltransferase [Bergeyella sp. RCAD1439]|uniref:TrmH family RNA methyltransferase n=1 Tax=Bergeyella anatis TaxID=3113737 RepID=UPI002E190B67|nr:RNA methyltransferase [Bergeyella sp. RCAD1439]
MITAHKVKIIQSLDKKKFRQKYNLFLVEGNKIIRELYSSNYKVAEIFSTDCTHEDLSGFSASLLESVSASELKKISFLQHPKDSLAVCELPASLPPKDCAFNLVLDGIQDPGNLGTLIRLADWFGIEQVVCSEDTVDVYNPKVIQASMGSFTRVNVAYCHLETFLKDSPNRAVGTDMQGDNIYHYEFPRNLNLVMGNEGNGIRPGTEACLDDVVSIPRFGAHRSTESLNVSVAAAIILGQCFSK